MGVGDPRNTHMVKPCDVCGDVGFADKLVTCFLCKRSQEHVYCMRVVLFTIPNVWVCELCRSSNGMFSGQYVSNEECRVFNSMHSMATEATKLPSMTRSTAPCTWGSSSCQLTTAPELIRTNGVCKRESSITQQLPHECKDTKHSMACQAKQILEEELSPALMPVKQESGHDIAYATQIKAEEFRTSPSIIALQTIGSGRGSFSTDVKPKSFYIQENGLVNSLAKLEKYFSNYPVPETTWCGSLKVTREFYDGFQAHFPSRVHRKAFDFSKKLPGVLVCTMLPSSKIRVEIFQNKYASVNDIALYIFPGNFERSKQQYEHLLGILETKELVLSSSLSGVELLVFHSKVLHANFQDLQSFLWGLYRPMKRNMAVVHISTSYPTPHAQRFNSQTENQLGHEVNLEQLNDSLAPPGFSRKAAGVAAAK